MLKFFKCFCLIVVFVSSLYLPTFAAVIDNEISVDQILKDFEDPTLDLDSDIINSDENLSVDGIETIEEALDLIKSEPTITENYDSALVLFSKDNVKGIKMFTDGNMIDFSKYNNVEPLIEAGRTLVPLRALAESIGALVDWIPEKNLIKITLLDKTIQLSLGSQEALINNDAKLLDVPAKSISGRTMIPARFVAEAFEKKVEWHAYSKDLNLVSIY